SGFRAMAGAGALTYRAGIPADTESAQSTGIVTDRSASTAARAARPAPNARAVAGDPPTAPTRGPGHGGTVPVRDPAVQLRVRAEGVGAVRRPDPADQPEPGPVRAAGEPVRRRRADDVRVAGLQGADA